VQETDTTKDTTALPLKITPSYLKNKTIDVLAVELRQIGLNNVYPLTITTLQGKYEGFFVSNVTAYSLEEGKVQMNFNKRQIT
jgi:hypothetical protein